MLDYHLIIPPNIKRAPNLYKLKKKKVEEERTQVNIANIYYKKISDQISVI